MRGWGQKSQGREVKSKSRPKDGFIANLNKRQKPLPKHTLGKGHRKYKKT